MPGRNAVAITIVLLLVVLSGIAVACTGASSQTRPVNPARPTPGSSPPGGLIKDEAQAISEAAGFIAGRGGSMMVADHIEYVAYVQTTFGQAEALIGIPGRMSGIASNTTTWLFVAQGDYAQLGNFATPPTPNTLWVIAPLGEIAEPWLDDAYHTATAPDLAKLGTPTVIPRGQVPEIDAKRAPLAATVQPPPVNPARPTPGPTPAGREIKDASQAIADAAGFIGGGRGSELVVENVEYVAYIQTSYGQAAALLGVEPMSGIPSNMTAWLFAAQGDYAGINRFETHPTTPPQTTLWVLIAQDGALEFYIDEPHEVTATARDLAKLGTPTVIPPGQVPAIDAKRASLAATSGHP